MGILLLHHKLKKKRHLMCSSVLVGRHPNCDLVIDDSRVPLYWLEIRWLGNRWGWRTSSGQESTYGAGASLDNGWRSWSSGPIRLGKMIQIELVDNAPPQPIVADLISGKRYLLAEASEWIHQRDNKVFSNDNPMPLLHGQIFQSKGSTFRYWNNQTWIPSLQDALDLAHKQLQLDIHRMDLRAVFTANQKEIEIKGEPVRVLWVYAETRKEESWDEDGGWLNKTRAFARWLEFGGNHESEAHRLNWERARVRRLLEKQTVSHLDSLFDRRWIQQTLWIRLNIPPEQIQYL